MMKVSSYHLPTDRLDFETHLKYVSLLAKLSKGVSVTCTLKPKLNKSKLNALKNKLQLIELTKKSIQDEYKIVQIDKEYSTASVLWLPIKTYYLAYHLLCITDYLISDDIRSLSEKHSKCIDTFTKMLSSGAIQFSEPLLNGVYDKSILNFKTVSGELLRAGVKDEILYKSLMKKIAKEKIENFKISNGIVEVRTKKNKDKVEKFKNSLTVSIFDFFYSMRLRMNYRNFNFIDDIPSVNTKTYFEEYYKTAGCFYVAFSNLKNKLISDISVGTV